MDPDHLSLLACPDCRGSEVQSAAVESVGGRIESADLACAGCGSTFELREGIARMLPRAMLAEADAAEAAKRSEMRARDDQAEAYDGMKMLRAFGKAEIPLTLRYLAPRTTDRLLEVGCGTGRHTATLAQKVSSFAGVDFSLVSLRRCRRKLDDAGLRRASLFQGDACALPIRDSSFSRVVSCQVLEHMPDETARGRMVGELARVAAPDSNIVVSAYRNSLPARLLLKKQGWHDGGISYYRFDWRELRALLGTAFRIERKTGALVYLYVTHCKPAKP